MNERYDVQLGNNCSFFAHESLKRLYDMALVIGRQVCLLSFDFAIENKRGFVAFTLTNCMNFERLSLENVTVFPRDNETLIEALRGDLRGRLLSLNLNLCKELAIEFVCKLADILADRNGPPALQELQVYLVGIDAKRLVSLHKGLIVNRTLGLVELAWPKRRGLSEPGKMKRERLETSFQGQVLRAVVLTEAKLAFLSVVGNKTCRSGEVPTLALQSLLLSQVFVFAVTCVVHHQIVWNADIEQQNHYHQW